MVGNGKYLRSYYVSYWKNFKKILKNCHKYKPSVTMVLRAHSSDVPYDQFPQLYKIICT